MSKDSGKTKNIFVYLFFGIWALFILSGIISALKGTVFSTNDGSTKLADGFTIEAYLVKLEVQENNVVYVTEEITVNFTNAYKHGIYKFTPTWLPYTAADGKTVKRRAKITELRAIGDNYTVDWVSKKARIKIGDADVYEGEGIKQYIIKYTYDMGSDPFKGFDEFIFHAYGDYWGTEIKNARIEVVMPKNIDNYNVKFFFDKYRKEEATPYVNYQINGNILTAEFDSAAYHESGYNDWCSHATPGENCQVPDWANRLHSALTVDIELPEGYFVKGNNTYGYVSLGLLIAIIVMTILTAFRWRKYGKDFPKRAQTIEFYPPENFSSAEIGYVFSKQSNKKLTISLIVSLASKGYIKIDEVDKKILIIKNMPIVKRATVTDEEPIKRSIELRQLKAADEALSAAEKKALSLLFGTEKYVRLQSDIATYLQHKDYLIAQGYIEEISDNLPEIQQQELEQKAREDIEQRIYDEELRKFQAGLLPLNDYENLVYERLFETADEVLLAEHQTFYKTFSEISSKLNTKLRYVIEDKKANRKFWLSILVVIGNTLFAWLAYSYFEDMNPRFSLLYLVGFACILVNLFFTVIMKRKTDYGEIVIAKVKGFRDFLLLAEKPMLEELVAADPHYFYHILPYTYVLGISNKWIKKFEDIPMPVQDMGSFDYGSSGSFDSIGSSVTYPSSSGGGGSGSSGCGGGCSSCGGGCSSCGGGGSW